jgi:hypothetical protein
MDIRICWIFFTGKYTWIWYPRRFGNWLCCRRHATGCSVDRFLCYIWSSSAVTTKSLTFWIVTPCSSKRTRFFRGTYCLHLRGRNYNYSFCSLISCQAWTYNRSSHPCASRPDCHLLLLVSCLAYCCPTTMEAICSSETSGSHWTL